MLRARLGGLSRRHDPVGAVVADPSGEIVARGRNRIFDDSAPPGQLAGSYLAHAELNALVGLPRLHATGAARSTNTSCTRTLEPCALCMGAALMMVGEVRFASLDHYSGGSGLRLENPHTARLPLRLSGPLDGLLGELGELLHLPHFAWRKPDGNVLATYRERNPELLELAESLDLSASAEGGAGLDEVIALVEAVRG